MFGCDIIKTKEHKKTEDFQRVESLTGMVYLEHSCTPILSNSTLALNTLISTRALALNILTGTCTRALHTFTTARTLEFTHLHLSATSKRIHVRMA